MKRLLIIAAIFAGSVMGQDTLMLKSGEQQARIPVKIDFGSGMMIEPFRVNSAGLLTIRCKYINTGEKTIKYLTVEVLAINTVGDVMQPEVGRQIGRIIGPILPGAKLSSWNNFSTYYRSKIASVKIRVIEAEYIDGTINTGPTDYAINELDLDEAIIKTLPWVVASSVLIFILFLN